MRVPGRRRWCCCASSPPSEEVIYHTLLQLYLQPRLADEGDTSDAAIAASQSARR